MADEEIPHGPRRALEAILASDPFQRSKRNSELLTHLVTAAATGRADELNGTTIAQDVFGKGSEFDPASDPSVRVQMGRLRRLLNDYYEDAGLNDPIRIEIPKGSYVPLFVPHGDPDRPAPGVERVGDDPDRDTIDVEIEPTPVRGDRRRIWRAAAMLIVAAALVLFVLHRLHAWPFDATVDDLVLQSEVNAFPVVVVRAFENRTGDPLDEPLVRGFKRQFAADLQRFRNARVAIDEAPPSSNVPGMRARADFIVTGAVLETSPTLDVIVWLLDVEDASIAVTERLRLDVDGAYADAPESFSQQLSAHFAAPRGQLSRAAFGRVGGALPDDAADLAAFRCLALFNDYVANRENATFESVYDCLLEQTRLLPNDGSLLAALAWMTLLGSPEAELMDDPPEGYDLDVDTAFELASRAVAIDPANDRAHVYLGLTQWFRGQTSEALASMRRAVRINPANPQHRADYALFLALAGRWSEALPLAREALEWDIDPPGWYRLAFFFRHVMTGNGRRAQHEIELGASRSDAFDTIYRLVAASMVGDEQLIERLRREVLELPAARAGDALRGPRRWLQSRELLTRMEHHLRGVGVPVEGNDAETAKPS